MGWFELIALGQLAAFGVAAGLLLAILLQPKRGRADGLFIVFCLALILWSAASYFPSLHPDIRTALRWIGLSAAGFMFFLVIARLIKTENRLVTGLTLLLPVSVIGALLVILTGNVGTLAALSSGGILVLIVLLLYAISTFWAIMISRQAEAAPLRLAGVVFIAAYALPLFTPVLIDLALIFAAMSALWTGWNVLRRQLTQPLHELQDELRIANADLRQAVAEAGSERAKNISLSEELRSASQLRNAFLEDLGHRLRTPLNSISGYNQLLQSGVYGELNERQRDRLETIGRNSDVLLETISDLLDISALDSGRLELHPQPVALKSLVARVIDEVETARLSSHLTLTADVQPDLALVLGDEARLHQVIRQLLGNAIKYTLEGSVTLRALNVQVQNGVSPHFSLPLRGWLSDGEWVVICVEDTGIGIAPEDQSKIFDPFYQTMQGQISENKGSGLGLAISKRLIERHEGVMWVKSTLGKGSSFWVALHAFRPTVASASQTQVGEKDMAQ